jgi:hypothetical protein
MRSILAALAATTMLACGARAADTPLASTDSNEFLRLHDADVAGVGRDETEIEILGMVSGLLEANAYLVAIRKEAPIYCQPPNLSLTSPQLVDMLRRGIAQDQRLGKLDIGFSMVAIMRKTFPCPNNSN